MQSPSVWSVLLFTMQNPISHYLKPFGQLSLLSWFHSLICSVSMYAAPTKNSIKTRSLPSEPSAFYTTISSWAITGGKRDWDILNLYPRKRTETARSANTMLVQKAREVRQLILQLCTELCVRSLINTEPQQFARKENSLSPEVIKSYQLHPKKDVL